MSSWIPQVRLFVKSYRLEFALFVRPLLEANFESYVRKEFQR